MKVKYLCLLLFLSFLNIPNTIFAQIVFDNNPATTNAAGTANTVEVMVPVGTDRLLIAMIGTNDLIGTPTVTFNGQTLTKAGEDTDNFNTTYDAKVLVYYLVLGDGAAITSDIAVTGLSNAYTIGGLSFQGIDQSSPLKQAVQAPIPTGTVNTSQIAASIVGVSEGNLLFAFLGEDNVQQFGWGGNYIAGGTHINSGINGAGYYYASYNAAATAGDHTFTYDINNGIQSCAGVLIEFSKKSTITLPTVSIAVAPNSTPEDDNTTIDYTFTVNPAPISDLTINYTISGTAEDDNDFTVSTPSVNNETISYTPKAGTGNNTGTITIKAGQTTGVLRITPTSDTNVETDETIIVTINN